MSRLQPIQGRKAEAGSVARVSAREIEALVLSAMVEHLAEDLPEEAHGRRDLFKHIDLRVSVGSRALELTWQDPVDEQPEVGSENQAIAARRSSDDAKRSLSIPYVFDAHKRRREIILPTTTPGYIRPIEHDEQQSLTRSIAQGRGWLKEVLAGTSIAAIAARASRSERMIRMTLSLAFLDPKLVRAALGGSLPRGVSTRRLIDAPMLWHDQWQQIGLSRPC